MDNKIDLRQILRGCPKGTELYSPLFGPVYFHEINDYSDYSIIVTHGTYIKFLKSFTSDGRYLSCLNGECMLFPSKDNRDWSTFRCPTQKFSPYTLNPFDKVLVRTEEYNLWTVDLFSFFGANKYFKCIGGYFKRCIPYNDETKYLVGTSDDAPEYYRYWED